MADDVAYMVASHFCHHSAWHTGASERDDAVERRASRNGLLRLVVLEKNIQHGFSYTYYSSIRHIFVSFFISRFSGCFAVCGVHLITVFGLRLVWSHSYLTS